MRPTISLLRTRLALLLVTLLAAACSADSGEADAGWVDLGVEVVDFAPASPAAVRVQFHVTNPGPQTVTNIACAPAAYVAGRDVAGLLEGGNSQTRLAPGERHGLALGVGVKDQQAAYVDRVSISCRGR